MIADIVAALNLTDCDIETQQDRFCAMSRENENYQLEGVIADGVLTLQRWACTCCEPDCEDIPLSASDFWDRVRAF